MRDDAFGAARTGPTAAASPGRVRVFEEADGGLAYAVPFPLRETPAVTGRTLLVAWEEAREGAAANLCGPPRRLLFARRDAADPSRAEAEAGGTELRLTDPDAGCWAEALDAAVGLGHAAGVALLLRLLALLDAMARHRWLADLYELAPGGTLLHPDLLSAAAALPLDAEARLEEAALRDRLAHHRLAAPAPATAPRRRPALAAGAPGDSP